jgi:hypothetical protein
MHPDGIVSTAGEAFWNNVRSNMKVKNHAILGSRLQNEQRLGSFRGPMASFEDVSKYYGPLMPELDQRWRAENLPDAGDQLARFRLARQQAPEPTSSMSNLRYVRSSGRKCRDAREIPLLATIG